MSDDTSIKINLDDANLNIAASNIQNVSQNTAGLLVSNVPVATEKETREAAEALYKQNYELSIKNKTLTLLGDLYKISVLALEPAQLAEKLTKIIREDLEYEVVELFLYQEDEPAMFSPLHYSSSDKFVKACESISCTLHSTNLPVAGNALLTGILQSKNPLIGETLRVVWGGAISDQVLDRIDSDSIIKTVLAFPLIIEGKIKGLLVMGFNREYDSLIPFEKEAISNIVNVTAVALDKALLYKELQDANEELKSLDKLKTEFLGLASHQLRAPLTSIKGYSSLLLEGSYGAIASEDQKTAIDRIFQSSQNLARVIEDLLDVSKIEQGGMKYEMSPQDMEKMATGLVNELQLTAKNKGLELMFEEKEMGSFIAKADPVKIRQVLLNLVDNSIKYTQKGFVKVSLYKSEPGKFRIAVTDSGMGISKENIGKLFEKFSRGDGGKVNAGGSGLGLYLAKEIVLAHGGTVWAESPGVGQGSSFIVELPEVASPPKQHS